MGLRLGVVHKCPGSVIQKHDDEEAYFCEDCSTLVPMEYLVKAQLLGVML